MLKTCSKCRQAKPRSEFGKSKDRKDGLYPQCRACRAAYYVEHAAEKRAWQVNYAAEHRVEKHVYNIAYYAANRARIRASVREYYAVHAAEIRDQKTSYRMTAAGMLVSVRANAKRRGTNAT